MRIFLAAGETAAVYYTAQDWEAATDRNFFCSFWYARKTTKALAAIGVARKRSGYITIDSGAHSFFHEAGFAVTSAAGGTRQELAYNYDKYVEEYIAWLRAHWSYFDFFVEVDIQELVGKEKVEEWRSLYRKHGLWDKCITVFHSGIATNSEGNTWEDYESMIAQSGSRYVGIEGKRNQQFTLPYSKMATYAYQNDCRIHVFAAIDDALILSAPIFSTDSRGWGATISYGAVTQFNPRRGKLDWKLKASEKETVTAGLPIRLAASSKDHRAKLVYAMEQYALLEEYYTKVWKARGVDWNGVVERIEGDT